MKRTIGILTKNTFNSFTKIIFLSFFSIIYFLEFFVYYVLSSPVDPGFKEDRVADLNLILILCFTKVLSISVYYFILNKLKMEYENSYVYLVVLSSISAVAYLPMVSFSYNVIIALRIFTPIIVNILIILILGNSLRNSLGKSKMF
ncbi:hypothetical protein [Inconstantimicrobium mannanitabidum]|uniref:Uncharacterized protein n=1 Tax=Inconstantimicrobium mannanitabidum TaxID=1604901 RepID=A0ACB5R9L2_9CLOT|nr:hypothetical protein [Clostridium sp. TW13]GKX65872.1 hypothetical protein rsdtw13_11300 [Clostridium sp. TW13]